MLGVKSVLINCGTLLKYEHSFLPASTSILATLFLHDLLSIDCFFGIPFEKDPIYQVIGIHPLIGWFLTSFSSLFRPELNHHAGIDTSKLFFEKELPCPHMQQFPSSHLFRMEMQWIQKFARLHQKCTGKKSMTNQPS